MNTHVITATLATLLLTLLACSGDDSATDAAPIDSTMPTDSTIGDTTPPLDSSRADSSPADSSPADTSPTDATPDAPPPADVCDNGLDDDADGNVDEGCDCTPAATQPCYGGVAARAGIGICTLGIQACVPTTMGGAWGDCTGWTDAAAETCDMADQDCDATVDEGVVELCAEGGVRTCTAGTFSTCETCDGTDEDADGSIDEGLIRACTDRCAEWGFQACAGGMWGTCAPGRTFDATVDRGGVIVDATSLIGEQMTDTVTLSHTTSATLTARMLVVGVGIDSPTTVTSVTYGGTALTALDTWTASSGFEELQTSVYYLLDPPTGAANIVISLPEVHQVDAGAWSLGNVSGAPVALGSNRARDTTPTLDVDATPAGLIIDFLGKEARHEIFPAPESELGWDMCGPGYARFGSSIRAADGMTSLSWRFRCCSDQWILGAVLVTPL